MKKIIIISYFSIIVYIYVLISSALKGSTWLRDASIDGWLWGIAVLLGFFVSVGCFVQIHSAEVKNAAKNYVLTRDELTWKRLKFKPAFISMILYLFIMLFPFVVVWYYVYVKDFSDMKRHTYLYLGDPLVYLVFSLLFAIVAVLFANFVLPKLEKLAVRSKV